jgi:hypothetical protein
MNDRILREQVLALLRGGNAHMMLDDAVADFPLEQINTCPTGVSYSFWHLLEHIRIAQVDILEFVTDPNYISPSWPEGYWPAPGTKSSEQQWRATVAAIQAGIVEACELVSDEDRDLTAELAHAPGYTLLREALLIADHNAYHLGEFSILRQVMGVWPKSHV